MMRNWVKIFVVIVMVLVVDLTTKHFLSDVSYFNLIPNVISVATNGGNDGAAWGILGGKTLTLIVITFLMLVALFMFNHFVKNKCTWYCIAFGLIVGGAIGNFADRVMFSYVRDFIYLDFWPSFPVFNLADSCLCVGAFMLAIFILFFKDDKGNSK